MHTAKLRAGVWDIVKNQKIPKLGVVDNALHMPGSPNLISIGELVEEKGWKFSWEAGCCELLAPNGKKIIFQVINNVPTIAPGKYDISGATKVLQQNTKLRNEFMEFIWDSVKDNSEVQKIMTEVDAQAAETKKQKEKLEKKEKATTDFLTKVLREFVEDNK